MENGEYYTNYEEDLRAESEREYRRKMFYKRKRRKRIKRIIISFLVVLSIFGGYAAAKVNLEVSNVLNRMDRDQGESLSNVDVDQTLLSFDNKVINILLIGSDKRIEWTETGRSDSVMIATLDMKNKRLKVTSLMRDMYVEIPEYGQNRFNAAYSFGGVGLLYQTIAKNFEIKLDGYVVVDFAAFKSVVNTIGGVDIELTDAEYQYLTTAYKRGSVLKLKPGLNNMNGTQALAYTRIRQDAMGDFGRTQRQRKVLQAMFTKAKGMSLSELTNLAGEIMPYIATDLSNQEIISYITSVIMLGTTEIDQFRIPIDNSFTQDRIRNMAVLIPDLEVNKQALHEFIFEYDGVEEAESQVTDANTLTN